MIDDFEDRNDGIRFVEGRVGFWRWIRDTDAEDTVQYLIPALRPDATPGNRFAVHVKGGRHSDWGAVIEARLSPGCYDASVYAGVAFSLRGPARVRLDVRDAPVVPVQWGGTCRANCYLSAHTELVSGAGWQRFEVRWAELEPTGSGRRFDPSQLNGVSFVVPPDATPYDFWLDDVELLRR